MYLQFWRQWRKQSSKNRFLKVWSRYSDCSYAEAKLKLILDTCCFMDQKTEGQQIFQKICYNVFNQWDTSCQIPGYSVSFHICLLCRHQHHHQQSRGRSIKGVMNSIFNRPPSVFWLKALSRIIKTTDMTPYF